MLLAHYVAGESRTQRLAGCLFPGWREASSMLSFLLRSSPTVTSHDFHGAGRYKELVCSALYSLGYSDRRESS